MKYPYSVSTIKIKMVYYPHLFEMRIQSLNGALFELKDDDGFLSLLGFKAGIGINHKNVNVPKLFANNLIYISLPEIGTHIDTSQPFTFLALSQGGFKVVSNINNTFANQFKASNKSLDEITVYISDDDGIFINNKGDANFIMVLSY